MSTTTSQPHPQPHSRHTPFTNDPVIRVDGLTRIYATGSRKKKAASTDSAKSAKSTEYTAVDGISFEVHRGEVYGLLGTNGAGKTSSLEVIEGLAAPSSGSVTIFGRDPRKERDIVRPSLGIMLQSGGLPRELTVAETMRMWSGTCSTPRPIAEVLAEVGLEHRTDVRVGSLSGGEQRRLDLACALLNDPSVVFLDEPTTGLDPESRARTWDLLDGLKQRGVTMVLTTHYLEEAEHLADRIAIMDAGSIAVEGRLSELVAAEPSEITFSLPGGPEISDALPYEPDLSGFPDFAGSVVTREGHRFSIATPHLQHDTLRLLTWASSQRLDLEQFTARPANLEKVFHSVVGRRNQSI